MIEDCTRAALIAQVRSHLSMAASLRDRLESRPGPMEAISELAWALVLAHERAAKDCLAASEEMKG